MRTDKIENSLADLLRRHPESSELVADILDFIASKKGPKSPRSNVVAYSVDHTGQLAEHRKGRQPFRADRELYDKLANTLSKKPLRYKVIAEYFPQPPDILLRMILRFWRSLNLISRSHSSYSINKMSLQDFKEATAKAWKDIEEL
jgi:hypothetical protein